MEYNYRWVKYDGEAKEEIELSTVLAQKPFILF